MKIVRKNTPKKLPVAHYVRVSVKKPDDSASTPRVDWRKLSEEELRAGIYIPTQERFFRNTVEGDIARAKYTLEDWLRQKDAGGHGKTD